MGARRWASVGGEDDGLTSSDDDETCDSVRVDDLLVSSSSDAEDDGANAEGEIPSVHAVERLEVGEETMVEDEDVRAAVRRAARRRARGDAKESDSSDAEGEGDGSESEDGLVVALEREARAFEGMHGARSTSATDAREEARRALETLRARSGKRRSAGNAKGSVGCVVDLSNVRRVTDAMMDTVDAGRAMCCASGAGGRVAVGTEGGFIFLERGAIGETTMSILRSANNFAGISATPGVTSLCFDERGDWLLAGHDDGGLTLWDVKRNPTILKTVVGVHRTPIVALVMLAKANSSGAVDVVSSEEGGLVIHHTFSPLGMGVIRVKSSSLGERTFVIAAQALPSAATVDVNDLKEHENGVVSSCFGETSSATKGVADSAGIVALNTMNAVLVMRLNPKAEVIAKIVRPPNMASSVLPIMHWSPRWAEDIIMREGVEVCNLIVVWGASVYVLTVDVESAKPAPDKGEERSKRASNTSRITHSWKMDSEASTTALAAAWLAQDLICILSSRNKLLIYTPSGELVERIPTGEPPVPREFVRGVTGNDAGSERVQNWHGSVTMHGVYIAILSPSRLRQGKFLGWLERVRAKKLDEDWIGAFDTLLQAYSEELPLWPALSKKYADVETTRMRVVEAFISEIPSFLDAYSRVDEDEEPEYLANLTRAIFALLLVFDALDKVYAPAVFDAFLNSKCRANFLEGMVPHILTDKLRSLPAEVMQALVEHYASLGEADTIEKCVLHMDVTSLDLNQIARLCKHHGMFSALAHVFTRALNDFVTPIEAMFQASLVPAFGDKVRVRQLLLFIHKTIRGERFPIVGDELSSDVVARFRFEVMKFLLEPVDVSTFTSSESTKESIAVNTWMTAMQLIERESASTQPPPLRLLYLFLIEPKATTDVMAEFLKNWDASEIEIMGVDRQECDRMASQIVAEVAVLTANAFGSGGHTSSRSQLLTFTASLVGSGRAAVSQEIERELLEDLALTSTKRDAQKREDAMVLIISRRIEEDIVLSDESRMLELARGAHFAQAEAVIHISSGDHISALKTLAGDAHRPNAAVHYVDVLLGTATAGKVMAEQVNAGPAVARAHALDAETAKSFYEEILAIMPALAGTSADVCARIAIAHFPLAQDEVLRALSSEPVLQFQYLRQVLETVHGGGVMSEGQNMSLAELVSSTKSIVTAEMSELYLRLMCQFEPQDVLKYLQSESGKSLDQAQCLEHCREFNVMDALAYLLEALGKHDEALSIHLSSYSTGVRAMIQLSTTGGAEWARTAPAESLMKGLIIEASESLRVAIALCRRVSSGVQNGEEMWWSCLDSIVRSLLALGDGDYVRVRDMLDEQLDEVLRVMLGRVDNGHLLEMIVARYGNEDISELRKLLSRVFGNCASERDFLKAEGTVVQEEADRKVLKNETIRRRAQRGTRRTVTY